MPTYTQKHPKQLTNGNCVGILDANWLVPYVPGDTTNASTYDFPVLYKMVTGVDLKLVLAGDPGQAGPIIEAVQELAREGARCITGDCGFLIHYQQQAADAVDVPVFMSSLLQLPVIESLLGDKRSIAILCADRASVDNTVLEKAGSTGNRKIVVDDLANCPEFSGNLLQSSDSIDTDKVETEVVSICRTLQANNPGLGAFLFECSMLPPYSHAVQAATRLPVFDFVTMINLFQNVTHRSAYSGYF